MTATQVTIPSDNNWTIWLWSYGEIEIGTTEDYSKAQEKETRQNRIRASFSEHSLDYPTPGDYLIDLSHPHKPVLTPIN